MANITITRREETGSGWGYGVNIDGLEFEVSLDNEYYNQLTSGHISPNSLIKKSFEFLLKREHKESIFREFNLKDITKYFPGYEREISV